jgi:hypothetical protein
MNYKTLDKLIRILARCTFPIYCIHVNQNIMCEFCFLGSHANCQILNMLRELKLTNKQNWFIRRNFEKLTLLKILLFFVLAKLQVRIVGHAKRCKERSFKTNIFI